MDGWWRNLWRGHGSKHVGNDHRSRRRGESGKSSASQLSLLWRIKDMGEAEDLYKADRVIYIVCAR